MADFYNNNEETDESLSYNVHDVSCSGCNSTQIYSDRYRCLVCVNYDLCGNCFEERRQTKAHLSGHTMAHLKVPNELFGQFIRHSKEITLTKIHELLAGQRHDNTCSGCRTSIVGVRFKCDTCYNYNLCSRCMEQRVTSKQHQNTHPLVPTSNQSLMKININDIRKGDILGQGAFGQVCKAKWISKNRQVACKVIRVTPQRQHLEESFRKELAAYAELSGAYILKTFGYGDRTLDHGIKECYLITELMQRGSLSNVIRRRDERISLRRKVVMACHIASGMRKLHAHTMIHRDIRPDNILVSDNFTAKIGDMGIAHIFNPDERHTLVGCLPFMPPEFYRGDGQYDQSLDVFTFGLTLNELFTEKTHRFIQSTRRVQLTEHSPIFSDMIRRCIRDEPARRPTALELENALFQFRLAADQYINEKCLNYSSQTLTAKDGIIVRFYDEYHTHKKAEPKPVFSPPPASHLSLDLSRQHFDDMMKQFDSVHKKEDKHRPEMVKLARYLDRPKPSPAMEAAKRERRPSTPSADLHHAHQENHQQFLHVVNKRRSRTPTPRSPRLQDPFGDHEFFPMPQQLQASDAVNDMEQRMRRLRLEAGIDHQLSPFPRMRRLLR